MFLDALQRRLGAARGLSVWNDLRERLDPEAPVTIDRSFPYQSRPPRRRTGNVIVDDGSFTAWQSVPDASATQRGAAARPAHMSNSSCSGQALLQRAPAVRGRAPVGYIYPGLLMEMDLHGGGIDARGAACPGLPRVRAAGARAGLLLERHLGGQRHDRRVRRDALRRATRATVQGQLPRDAEFRRRHASGPPQPVRFRKTVHGPVIGYATVDGRRVAISEKRSTRGRDVLERWSFQDLTRTGSGTALVRAIGRADRLHVQLVLRRRPGHGDVLGGRLPNRPPAVDRACRRGTRRVRVARLPAAAPAPAADQPAQRRDDQLEQQAAPTTSLRRTQLGQRLGPPHRHARGAAWTCAAAHARLGRVGDEPGGHARTLRVRGCWPVVAAC